MATCPNCDTEMQDRIPCTLTQYDDFRDGIARDRKPFHPEDSGAHCRDCLIPAGGLHHPGCDAERCPSCQGQAISCNCVDSDEDDD